MRIFVIGFMGSDRKGLAQKLAAEHHYKYVDLDGFIEEKDGRTIRRICMLMGEHEYRNKEYEALREICKEDDIVVACGDGILLDDMNVETLKKNTVVVADADATVDELWARCTGDNLPPYAFMASEDETRKKEKFCFLYETRKKLYEQFLAQEA